MRGEFVRRQATFLHYCNNFAPDISKDSETPVGFYKVCSYYILCVHVITFFSLATEVVLVALVPVFRIKVDSGSVRHIVAFADHQ